MTSPDIKLYTVGGKSKFNIPEKGEISYLVAHFENEHYSYGFEPSKVSEEEARKNFLKDLEGKRATKINYDGGRLDGKDLLDPKDPNFRPAR